MEEGFRYEPLGAITRDPAVTAGMHLTRGFEGLLVNMKHRGFIELQGRHGPPARRTSNRPQKALIAAGLQLTAQSLHALS